MIFCWALCFKLPHPPDLEVTVSASSTLAVCLICNSCTNKEMLNKNKLYFDAVCSYESLFSESYWSKQFLFFYLIFLHNQDTMLSADIWDQWSVARQWALVDLCHGGL